MGFPGRCFSHGSLKSLRKDWMWHLADAIVFGCRSESMISKIFSNIIDSGTCDSILAYGKLNMIQQCPGSQEGQACPGGHQAQQGKGGDCPALL